MKRILIAVVLILSMTAGLAEGNHLSFMEAADLATLQSLDGQTVTITGYMATLSPIHGKYIYLMNLPYQSCPFCVPNTSQLSNTMEVYPKKGKKFEYTSQAVKVTGKLEVSESKDKSFTDMYGYEFNFRIVDAEYDVIKESDLSPKMKVWQKIADSGVVNDLYSMYDYLNFLCAWPTYSVQPTTLEDGSTSNGYYLYAEDAKYYITTDGAQWNYGYKDGYFDDLIKKVEAVDKNEFASLVQNIGKAKDLAAEAINELMSDNYTSEYKYVDDFDTWDYIYTLNRGEELTAKWQEIYSEFSDWLAGWEL